MMMITYLLTTTMESQCVLVWPNADTRWKMCTTSMDKFTESQADLSRLGASLIAALTGGVMGAVLLIIIVASDRGCFFRYLYEVWKVQLQKS